MKFKVKFFWQLKYSKLIHIFKLQNSIIDDGWIIFKKNCTYVFIIKLLILNQFSIDKFKIMVPTKHLNIMQPIKIAIMT